MTALLASIGLLIASGQIPDPIEVKPSDTDPRITQFNDPHLVYSSEKMAKRNELLIFLPGTNGKPGGTNLFCQTAADVGYHVLALAYPTDVPATQARNDPDPKAFERFRMEIITGEDMWPRIQVDRTNSIENRLIKAIAFLHRTRPAEGWGQFLDSKEEPVWTKIAVSGQSQGGGHAGLIGAKRRVARVVMTGAPKDFRRQPNEPAPWYRNPATPAGAFFAFNHVLDQQGCDYDEQILNLKALGVDKFGGPVLVDGKTAPFGNSRMLFTNFEGSPQDSVRAHTSVIGDRGTPKDAKGEPVFREVWKYMLTAPIGP